MKIGKVTIDSLKRTFTNRFIRFAIVAIIIIPMLFGLLYVIAFWDPQGRMENLPVAIANNDVGATRDGVKENYGDEILKELKKNHEVKWVVVDGKKLEKGIEHTDYYMAFVIPENFSASVISAENSTPNTAQIIYLDNQRKNFLLSQIGNTVKTKFSDTVSAAITKEYTAAAFDNLYKVKDGMNEAATGSESLNKGINTLGSKVPTLANGINQAADGAAAIKTGLGELNGKIPEFARGARELNQGIKKMQNEAPALTKGVGELAAGSKQLKDGLGALDAGIGDSGAKVDQSLSQIIALLQNAQSPDEIAAAVGALTKLQAEYNQGQEKLQGSVGALKDGANQLNSGINQVAGNAPALSSGLGKLAEGSSALASGADEIQGGVGKLYNGASSLTSGMSSLNAAVPMLTKGVTSLKNGSGELSSALKDGSKEMDSKLINSSKDMSTFIADPEKTTTQTYGAVGTYGPGFAPFFLSLGLWIGALLIFFIVEVRPPEKLTTNSFKVVFGKLPTFLIIGILQAVAVALGALAIGVKVTNISAFILFSCLSALVFVVIMQNLNLLFGLGGKAMAIIFLMLQLSSCGGTFPVELVPEFFKTINPFMPFTYTVDGYREIISGGDMSIVFQDVKVLLCVAAGFIILSLIGNKFGAKIEKIINKQVKIAEEI
ncbi:MAG: YhgE/Pip domain-containing protein [Clostridiales bacterium]